MDLRLGGNVVYVKAAEGFNRAGKQAGFAQGKFFVELFALLKTVPEHHTRPDNQEDGEDIQKIAGETTIANATVVVVLSREHDVKLTLV